MEQTTGLFQCSACQRSFNRVDHLTRHVRSHLQERPFRCPTCNKTFGRSDLLKRHSASHETNADSRDSKRAKHHHNHAPRVSHACKQCAAVKLKCDDETPCGRCLQKGLSCSRGGHPTTQGRNPDLIRAAPANLPDADRGSSSPQPDLGGKSMEFIDRNMSGFPRGSIAPALDAPLRPYQTLSAWSDFLPGDDAPRALLDFATEANLEFDESDFCFIGQLCGDAPKFDFHLGPIPAADHDESLLQAASIPSPPLPMVTAGNGGPQSHAAIGTEAFKRSSLGFWAPEPKDHTGAELQNLSVLEDEAGLSPDILPPGRCYAGDKLSHNARDEFLAMMLDSGRWERGSFAIKAFPTAAALDILIQTFFSQHGSQTDSFIHGPSFCPNRQKTLLLVAVVAAGAVLTDLKSVHKLGFAIQEAVRTSIPVMCEQADTATRELWLLQAFMCEIGVGLWSGIKRKMEIAESHPQLVYTMLRRAGRFNKLKRTPSPPLAQDVGEVLHRKCLEWVEQESFKRLVFHTFVTDAQTSMAMLTNPLISFAELTIPLPASRELWRAQNAEHWKALYLNRPTVQQQKVEELTLADCLQEPMIDIPGHYDLDFARLIILCGIWGMVWHQTQLLAMGKRPGHVPAAAIALRHKDLLQTVQHFRMLNHAEEGGTESPGSPETALVLELLSMHLHVSLADIQLFAGKQDLEDARQVLPSLQQWMETRESRQAVWHAGQVLHAARAFRPKKLRGFFTIALSHASLVMWAYGVISQVKGVVVPPVGGGGTAQQQPVLVFLDGENSPAVQRFIALGKGKPCISRHQPGMTDAATSSGAREVPLSGAGAVMQVFVDTLRGNFPCCFRAAAGEAAPPLVENMIQLLRDLGRAAAI
ncbi:hypothetical protein C8A01DRAFT_14751 [Parachaetomium inaequale]|uniref:Uncharacterized protein n=1 Tax=Parachaetomium inaequale TaxID=2588326 RepID=A0AAN6PIX5_9PEZI|nr:hypothetical protein C8A01DRAFT_14751 [Parachaetomium inaequale]